MPIPRTPSRRYQKWLAKFDPDVIRSRFEAVKDVATGNAQDGLIPYANFDFVLSDLLDKHGIAGPDRAKYRAFARKALRASYTHTQSALDHVILGLKSYFVTAYGCDPDVLDAIILQVLGYTPTY